MHVPGAMGGKPDSKPDLFRGFTFRREASFVGPPETAKRGSKEQLTRTASRHGESIKLQPHMARNRGAVYTLRTAATASGSSGGANLDEVGADAEAVGEQQRDAAQVPPPASYGSIASTERSAKVADTATPSLVEADEVDVRRPARARAGRWCPCQRW